MITQSKLSQHLHCVCLLFLVEYTKKRAERLVLRMQRESGALEACMPFSQV